MVADLQSRDNVRLEMMGQTLDGHDLDILIIGAPKASGTQCACACETHSGAAQPGCAALSLHVPMSSRV